MIKYLGNIKVILLLVVSASIALLFFGLKQEGAPDQGFADQNLSGEIKDVNVHKIHPGFNSQEEKDELHSEVAVDETDITVVYDNGNLSVYAKNHPLTLLLEEVYRLTKIEFYIEDDIQSAIVDVKLESVPLLKALESILSAYSFSFHYKNQQLSAVGVYPQNTNRCHQGLLDLHCVSEGEQVTDATNSPQDFQLALNKSASETETLYLIESGLESPDESLRALSFYASEQKKVLLEKEDILYSIFNDPSEVVRSNALTYLLSSEAIEVDVKQEVLDQLALSEDEMIKGQVLAWQANQEIYDQESVSEQLDQ